MRLDDVACLELVERITELLDGTLPAEERAAIDGHLAECPGCVAAVEQFRQTVRVLGHLRGEDVRQLEPEVVENLLAAFRRRTS